METLPLHGQPAVLMTGMWPLSSQAGWLRARSQEQSGPLKGSAEAPTAGCRIWNRWRRTAFPGLARNVKGLVAVCHPGLDVWDLSGPRLASHSRLQSPSAEEKDGAISLQTSPTVKVLRTVPASACSFLSLHCALSRSFTPLSSLTHFLPRLCRSCISSLIHSFNSHTHLLTHEAFDQRLLRTRCCLGC